jgi:TPR repeat protein
MARPQTLERAALTPICSTVPPRAPGLYGHGNHSSPSLVESGSPELLPNTGDHTTALDGQSMRFTPFDIPDLPYMPAVSAVDDLNIALENMRFESSAPPPPPPRPPSNSTGTSGRASIDPTLPHGRRYSPSSIGSIGQPGPDGAMEIRGYGGGDGTASVYSVESAFAYAAPPQQQQQQQQQTGAQSAWERMHGRNDSAASSSSRVNALAFEAEYRRDSFGGGSGGGGASTVDGYSEVVDPMALRRASEGSYLAYDDPSYAGSQNQARFSQPRMQQPQPGYGGGGGAGGDYFVGASSSSSSSSTAYLPPGGQHAFYGSHSAPPQQQQHQQHDRYSSGGPPPPGSVTFPQGGTFAPQPTFSPQVGQGGANWGGSGYDYQPQQVAAQNPYYAAATGQLGLEPALAGPSSSSSGPYNGSGLQRGISSVSSLGPPLPPPPNPASLSRSVSSLNVPGGPMRRKATSGSTNTVASSSSSSGPTITKASIDEYRQRVKADPDPEAQFNFAKYLIEAAKRLNSGANADDRVAKKYRDALLAESLKLIKRLATQGSGLGKTAYADAQFFLANCLGTGSLGLQIDHEKAYNLYVQASKQNHSAATYRTAVCNELGAGTRKDYARAVLFYRKASALGDTAGMYKLGMILLHGHLGQQRNPKEGLAWLRRAASQADDENPHALHELGLLYEKPPLLNPAGAGSLGAKVAAAQMQQQLQQAGQPPPSSSSVTTLVPFDPAQAREFFTQAAQLGYPPSQYKLGLCYEFGALTCPVDPRRSIAWYTRAAERNEPNAELALSGWYLTGSEGVLKQSDSEAYLWARRAANKGLPKAEYAVGYYAEVGIGVKADMEEAKRWYMRAAGEFVLPCPSPLVAYRSSCSRTDWSRLCARPPSAAHRHSSRQQARDAATDRVEKARRRQARCGWQEAADSEGCRDRVHHHVDGA